jgi:hypothetical protein
VIREKEKEKEHKVEAMVSFINEYLKGHTFSIVENRRELYKGVTTVELGSLDCLRS